MKMLKKPFLIALILGFSLAQAGCYGPFKLTKKLHTWNGTVGDKYINAITFLALNIVPVYGIVSFADAVVFNSIEFWTGNNPITMNQDEVETTYVTENNANYKVVKSKNMISITQVEGPQAGDTALYTFNPELKSWTVSVNGEVKNTVTIKDLDSGLTLYEVFNENNEQVASVIPN